MAKVITGFDKQIAKFVCEHVSGMDETLIDGLYTGIGILNNNQELVAGVIYSEYRKPTEIRASIAAIEPTWATRATLNILFSYPFRQLGVRRMTAVAGKKNKKSRDLLLRLGFKQEGNAREAMDNGDDAIIYGMLKKECKWLLQRT